MSRPLVVLPRRAVPQPKPRINPGGDCVACVLAGLVDTDVPAMYEMLKTPTGEGITDIYRQRDALNLLYYGGLLDRVVLDVPEWPVHDLCRSWGRPAWTLAQEWCHYTLMALDAVATKGWAHVARSMVGSMQQRLKYMLLGPKVMVEGELGPNKVLTQCVVVMPEDVDHILVENLFIQAANALYRQMNAHLIAACDLTTPVPVRMEDVGDTVGKEPGVILMNALTYAQIRKVCALEDVDEECSRTQLLTGMFGMYGEKLLLTSLTIPAGVLYVLGSKEDTGTYSYLANIFPRVQESNLVVTELVFQAEWSMEGPLNVRSYQIEGL